jgi:small subunit ribosomal protein S17
VAEEEKNNVEETAAEEVVEETPAPEEAAEETAPAAEADAASEDAVAEAPAEDAEPEEQLSPKERRKKTKAARNRKPKFTGTHEERRAQRDALRKKKAAARRIQRQKAREAHKAAGPREGTPPVEKEPGRKKIQQGTVVSSTNDKTIIVEIEVQESHRIYKKVVRRSKKLTAHDEKNDAGLGDTVRVIESRPLSKTKRWRLVEIVERAR